MHFTVYKGSNGQWYWTLYASNGERIADGAEGYWNKQDCLHGIALVKSATYAPIREKY